jgi:hypothetical protein
MRIEFVMPATIEMAVDLGPRLRQSDIDEVAAFSGRDAGQALVDGALKSSISMAMLIDGRCAAVAGVVRAGEAPWLGCIWCLASDEAMIRKAAFLKGSRKFMAMAKRDFTTLANYVDNRNTKSQRWLLWLGFTLEEPRPFGLSQMPFRFFWLKSHGDKGAPRKGAASTGLQCNNPVTHHV